MPQFNISSLLKFKARPKGLLLYSIPTLLLRYTSWILNELLKFGTSSIRLSDAAKTANRGHAGEPTDVNLFALMFKDVKLDNLSNGNGPVNAFVDIFIVAIRVFLEKVELGNSPESLLLYNPNVTRLTQSLMEEGNSPSIPTVAFFMAPDVTVSVRKKVIPLNAVGSIGLRRLGLLRSKFCSLVLTFAPVGPNVSKPIEKFASASNHWVSIAEKVTRFVFELKSGKAPVIFV